MPVVQIELTPKQDTLLQEGATEQGLDVSEYLRALVVSSLMQRNISTNKEEKKPRRSIMELHGLGAEAWKDENGQLVDAQKYVDELRSEWTERPE